ncbi:amidohydrolase [Mycolicibacterium smegmatis]|uniref:Amidohydrolase n=1 Tax=Mycolicibacterium smegmatis (strain MKD8) TaxID=1214915 RepID=A0A2U9PTV5_MYCSE|nr:amidohydrolase [Mycolicibacterium smegmatis MKD8]
MCTACEWAPHFTRPDADGPAPTRKPPRRSPEATAHRTGSADAHADFVFTNGRVHTVAGASPWAEAVAVRGNTITHVGRTAEVLSAAGPRTRVIDLGGRLLMPGFVEGHTHPMLGAFLSHGVDLQVPTKDDALAAIAAYAAQHPQGVVRGFGWRVDMFGPDGPSRADLDRVLPDRPGLFFAIDAHSMWANTAALQMAGVDRDTPDPVPGFSYFQRDADGEPTGYVLEVNAVLGLVDAVEPISAPGMRRMLEGWLPAAAAAGITTVFDAGVPPVGGDQAAMIALYADLEEAGALPLRVVASYAIKSPPPGGRFEDVLAQFRAARDSVGTDLVNVDVLKIVGDGTQGGYTAWLIEPYADKPDSTGSSPFTEEQWHEMIGLFDAAGVDVHVHACGERTARVALDAIERAIAVNGPRDRRHTIAHLVFVDDADAARFAELGVVAQFSANWFSADPDTVQNMAARYGSPRKDHLYRVRDILRAGGRISLGTDWPAAGYFSTHRPLDAIQIAVTRQLIGDAHAPVLSPADQRLSVAQAVHANTLGAAYQLRLDDVVGSVEVGKRADLIVLDTDIFEVDPHDIHTAEVLLTMMDGRIRHEMSRVSDAAPR